MKKDGQMPVCEQRGTPLYRGRGRLKTGKSQEAIWSGGKIKGSLAGMGGEMKSQISRHNNTYMTQPSPRRINYEDYFSVKPQHIVWLPVFCISSFLPI